MKPMSKDILHEWPYHLISESNPKGAGRPYGSTKPEENKKSKTIAIRLTALEYENIKEKADKCGKSISRFLVDLGLKKR